MDNLIAATKHRIDGTLRLDSFKALYALTENEPDKCISLLRYAPPEFKAEKFANKTQIQGSPTYVQIQLANVYRSLLTGDTTSFFDLQDFPVQNDALLENAYLCVLPYF